MIDETYTTDEAKGNDWQLWLGDSCERMGEIEADSVGSLFTFSDSIRDLSNNHSADVFHEQYGYIIRELLRVTMPGRLACVHCTQLSRTKSSFGYVGTHDFRGDVIRDYESAGWIYHGEVCVWKDPQSQAIRTKAQGLMFTTKNKDSAMSRPAYADYVLLFRKPGDNPVPVKTDVTNDVDSMGFPDLVRLRARRDAWIGAACVPRVDGHQAGRRAERPAGEGFR